VNGEMNTADMGMRKQKTYLGNIIFWLSFCVVGQPLIVLLYYRAWYMREHPELL
jgi:diacylglycerol O-acyltransferase-1